LRNTPDGAKSRSFRQSKQGVPTFLSFLSLLRL
jgi:hypothetical protein